ncbi:MAG: FHA domain-containing protein [Azoarcus sp.]|nr:FHA domain-containing protein [Azoarcus sp.]
MIWIETLSRHKEVVARVRAVGEVATIGRAYDNDAIVDDPFIAPRHVRLSRNEDGLLVAEDLNSRNGVYDESGARRHAMLLTGNTIFRIGKTWMRVREHSFFVDPEQVLVPPRSKWPWLLLASLLAVAVMLLTQWQTDIFERPDPIALYVQPLLWFALAVSLWVVFWAVLTRLFTGRARAARHAIVALVGFSVVTAAEFLTGWLAYAFSNRTLANYDFIVFWALLAVFIYAHLRVIGKKHRLQKFTVVLVLALCVCVAQWLGTNPFSPEETSDTGFFPDRMYPPSWRVAPAESEDKFFENVVQLREKIDALREQKNRGE